MKAKHRLAAVCSALAILAAVPAAQTQPSNIDLYVTPSGALDGDGSLANPVRRITDAVERARADREGGASEAIQIHVAPGTYVGSFVATELMANPEYEVLPIILNVDGLAVLGSTALVRDERGLPTGSAPLSDTILMPDAPMGPNQSLFLIANTSDGSLGNDVTIDGFVLDGIGGAYPHVPVIVDRVSGFRISNNLIQHGGFGIYTRLASGTVEGNLLRDNEESGGARLGGEPRPAFDGPGPCESDHGERAARVHGDSPSPITPIWTRAPMSLHSKRPCRGPSIETTPRICRTSRTN